MVDATEYQHPALSQFGDEPIHRFLRAEVAPDRG
jgi:hypothetical protein